MKVLEVYGGEYGITDTYGPETIYKKDEIVECDKWDANPMNICSSGIHYYRTRKEAENH